jgi:hypothetical protein
MNSALRILLTLAVALLAAMALWRSGIKFGDREIIV